MDEIQFLKAKCVRLNEQLRETKRKSQVEINELKVLCALLESKNCELEGKLAGMILSNSWKLTQPLRKSKKIINSYSKEWVKVVVIRVLKLVIFRLESLPQIRKTINRLISYFPSVKSKIKLMVSVSHSASDCDFSRSNMNNLLLTRRAERILRKINAGGGKRSVQ